MFGAQSWSWCAAVGLFWVRLFVRLVWVSRGHGVAAVWVFWVMGFWFFAIALPAWTPKSPLRFSGSLSFPDSTPLPPPRLSSLQTSSSQSQSRRLVSSRRSRGSSLSSRSISYLVSRPAVSVSGSREIERFVAFSRFLVWFLVFGRSVVPLVDCFLSLVIRHPVTPSYVICRHSLCTRFVSSRLVAFFSVYRLLSFSRFSVVWQKNKVGRSEEEY
ncbi:hypothetical protein K474DRAFT_286431 [Panus rudis PR-1116 ss-1]|nr:hypothetical protein K474DRAFT_286431 [Panus rudis PR-1116 ss-1]